MMSKEKGGGTVSVYAITALALVTAMVLVRLKYGQHRASAPTSGKHIVATEGVSYMTAEMASVSN